MTTVLIKIMIVLILNMALNFTLYVIHNNYRCDSPNSPPIHDFTHLCRHGGMVTSMCEHGRIVQPSHMMHTQMFGINHFYYFILFNFGYNGRD
jgi:hypothetical protein